jgi:hypothetical protein
MQSSKARALLKATLQTDVHFIESMRVYSEKTQGVLPRYENRLHFDFDETMWNVVDKMRQCRSCGQILVSTNRDVKLMSCGVCKITHYCNKECQKRDWKASHKLLCSATPIVKNLEASYLCVRILSIMSVSATSEGVPPRCETMENPDILKSAFSFEKTDAVSLEKNACVTLVHINDDDNPVCNHFRQKQESNRILFPIWDTGTDNLAFVPVSFGFMIGAPVGVCSATDLYMQKYFKIYSVGVKCVDDGRRPVLPVSTFIKVCAIDWE